MIKDRWKLFNINTILENANNDDRSPSSILIEKRYSRKETLNIRLWIIKKRIQAWKYHF